MLGVLIFNVIGHNTVNISQNISGVQGFISLTVNYNLVDSLTSWRRGGL